MPVGTLVARPRGLCHTNAPLIGADVAPPAVQAAAERCPTNNSRAGALRIRLVRASAGRSSVTSCRIGATGCRGSGRSYSCLGSVYCFLWIIALRFDSARKDDLGPPLVECGGWVRLRGLRSIGEDVVYLNDDRTPPPLHAHVISPSSLLGRLLIGCRVGDNIVFDAAGGRVTLTILDAGRHENGGRPT